MHAGLGDLVQESSPQTTLPLKDEGGDYLGGTVHRLLPLSGLLHQPGVMRGGGGGGGGCIVNASRVQGKCITIPTRTTSFSKKKGAALGGTRTHDTLLYRQSALPTELPGQLSKQGSKSTIQTT